jgi:hypothetical protein
MDRTIISSPKTNAPILPSRLAALNACRDALDHGPILLTGATGVGKTWLLKLLALESDSRAWLEIDCAPGMSSLDFLDSFCDRLGVESPNGSVGSTRLTAYSGLSECRQDGRPIALVFDEAHLASDALFEEIRLLANGMGRGNGLAALVISGQTLLAKRLDSKALAALETRLAARIHLLPLDLAETTKLLTAARPDLAANRELVEHAHRDVGGNPARLLRIVERLPRGTASPVSLETNSQAATGPMVPAKPPLRVEEGLIEVGWDSDMDAEVDSSQEFPSDTLVHEEEPVEDHYAALQAWDEWAKNQGRVELEDALSANSEDLRGLDEPEPAKRTALGTEPGLWADGKHGFGPYSQLFSRLKPLQEAE